MKKSNKLYKKALKKYYEGDIEKALEICERSISESIKNSSAINLKGLLYYLKGDIHSARSLWELSYNVNKDSIAKKYLNDSEYDIERLDIYYAALDLIKKLNINKALLLLKKCKESDFNRINVDNHIALCYIKKGEYRSAVEYVESVLEIDKKNKMALGNKNVLMKYSVIKKQFKTKSIIIIMSIILAFIAIFFSPNILQKDFKFKTKTVNTKHNIEYKNIEKDVVKPKEKVFSYKEVEDSIKNKDFNKIYDILQHYKSVDLKDDYKQLLLDGENIVKNEGIVYFYDNGIDSLGYGNNKDAKEWFVKAYDYGKESYLYPHIIFMLALIYEEENDVENCLKYYNEYDKLYPHECYGETVLYKLAILNNNMNKKEAKSYALRLQKDFPHSDYNNSIINEILE